MTWIIASPTIFGYGLGISDTRVTLSDGTTKDCLQKIYKVGDDIVAGFSGSVYIGFMMIEGLTQIMSSAPKGCVWQPRRVINEWPKFAKKIFLEAPKEAQQLGCTLIFIGNNPNEKLGDSPFSKTTVAILKSPNFNPIFVKIGKWEGIGSGMGIAQYEEMVQELNSDLYHPFMQMEAGNPGGMGFAVQVAVSKIIKDSPSSSVSPHVQMCTVKPNEIELKNVNFTEFNLTEKKEYKMPKLAICWEDLEELTSMSKDELAASSCLQSFKKFIY